MPESRIFVTADLHFDCPDTVERWNSQVRRGDTVYVLGNVTVPPGTGFDIIGKLQGAKRLIIACRDRTGPRYAAYFSSIFGSYEICDVLLTAVPMPLDYLARYRGNIHGQCKTENPRYQCVSLELCDHKPVRLSNVLKRMPKRGQNVSASSCVRPA